MQYRFPISSAYFAVFLMIFKAALLALCFVYFVDSQTLYAQSVSNLTIPSEEELRDALFNSEITFEEFELLLEYFYGTTLPELPIVAGSIPNLDLVGITNSAELDKLQQEQLAGIKGSKAKDLSKNNKGLGAWVRMYIDQELNGGERSRNVYQFRVGQNSGWRFEGAIGSAYGREALWRSRSLKWQSAEKSKLSIVLGNYDLIWGAGLALGRRGRLLGRQNSLSFESLLTPDRGGFNGVSVAGVTSVTASRKIQWQAIGSGHRDITNRLGTLALMGKTTSGFLTVGVLWGRNSLRARDGSGEFVQDQYSLSLGAAKSKPLWFNAEINTQVSKQSDAKVLTIAASAEWRYTSSAGNVRGAAWRYPRSYRNLTGGARSGILYESIEFEELEFSYRDRRINQTGGLLRSVTTLSSVSKVETGIEFSSQGRSGATRGDYILAYHRKINGHDLKLEAGGRTVTNSTSTLGSRWRLRAQLSSKPKMTSFRTAVTYHKETDKSPAIGVFARISRSFRTGSKLELWLNVSRYRFRESRIERFYSYLQYLAPINKSGSIVALTKLVYRYNDSSASRVVARFEVQTQW